ncbi:type II CRISPR RNA-guided endonuclease Cas9 [Gemella sp. Musashino-2025]
MNENKEWFLGLDIGTASVGWAATDTNYNLLKLKGKKSWGVRLFDEAQTAKERRDCRSKRRRLARRKWRLGLLEELFAEEINKIDPNFFMRLRESKYKVGDKTENVPSILFNDKNYTDKEYYRDYKTIYHLRADLIHKNNPDIRELFLAIHHILKYRGHFLFAGQQFKGSEIKDNIRELLQYNSLNIKIDITDELINNIAEILLKKKNSTDKIIEFKKLFADEKQLIEALRLALGNKTQLAKLFDIEAYKELDISIKTISFKEKIYEDVRSNYEEILGEYIIVLDTAKLIYDAIILSEIKIKNMTISESKVISYEKHGKDLKQLKQLIKEDSKLSKKEKRQLFENIFVKEDEKEANYVNYIGKNNVGSSKSSCSYEDFKKSLIKELKYCEESKLKQDILAELELETFLPRQRTKDNSVIPYQIHKEELEKILNNAVQYHPFLNNTDEYGISIKEKIIQLLEFRIPYYVGPLNTSHKVGNGGFSWSVRNKGYERTAVTPWNFNKVINKEESAKNFIENLTNQCTYLLYEDVLPKHSLLYSEFTLLNELNSINYGGKRLTVEHRNLIIERFFKQSAPKATGKELKKFLMSEGVIDGKDELSGFDISIKNDLKSYRDFKKILGEKFDSEKVEKMIRWITLFGESKQLLVDKITKEYGDIYSSEEIKKISGLTYKDWGRLSEKLLTEIVSSQLYDESTGECFNIINAMRNNTLLFIELLGTNYDYFEKINTYNGKLRKEITEITPHILDDLYVSPAVKRSIWQVVRIVEELKKVIGSEPKRIFVETTRSNKEKKGDDGRKDSRKKALLELYKKIKTSDIAELEKALGHTVDFDKKKQDLTDIDNNKLKARKLYLYYTQLGRCLYTGKAIDLNNLFGSNSEYDIDHIYPQSKTKDGSWNNLVLVNKTENSKKSNGLISESIQRKNKHFWRFLKAKNLISEEKYKRLTRTEDFTDGELSGFIARQLIETSQSVKVVSKILQNLNPTTELCFSKAENVSDFRQEFGKIKVGKRKNLTEEEQKKAKEGQLIKVRDLNDLHHAKDAYLNIVVGNVYHIKFTRNPKNFIRKNFKNREYTLNTLFYSDKVERNGEVAWEKGKTEEIVSSVMCNNLINVTRRTSEQKGALYEATIYKANAAKEGSYYPVKTNNKNLKNVTRYGGFTSIKIAYYSIFKYDIRNKDKVKENIKIIPIPIYISQNIKTDLDLINFAEKQIKLKKGENIENLQLIYKKLNIGALVKIDHYPYYIGGKTDDNFYVDGAVQVLLSSDIERYLKEVVKFVNFQRENKEAKVSKEHISLEENIKLYNTLVCKMATKIFTHKKNNKYNDLTQDKAKNTFNKLSLEEQCKVLLEILNLLTNKKTTFDLSLINEKTSRVKCGFNLLNQKQFSIIEQSVTGLYEKEIKIIED